MKHALRNLTNADVHDRPLQPEPRGKNGNEHPGVEAVEHHLKDAVQRDQPSNIVCVTAGQFIPDQHHRDAASDADEYQAAHVGGLATKEEDGEQEHQHRPDQPVLD